LAPFLTDGLTKCGGTLLPTVPGDEPVLLDRIAGGEWGIAERLGAPGGVIAVGERLAGVPGGLSAVVRLAAATGAAIAWIPRRAGERGALEAGAAPTLLPGGRPVRNAAARKQICDAWGLVDLPGARGRDTSGILAAAARGELKALVVGGVDTDDLPDPAAALAALDAAEFVVSLELRASEVTERADVVFPIPHVAEKDGTFLNWEGRLRPFRRALGEVASPMTDLRVLQAIADEMGRSLRLRHTADAAAELAALGRWTDGPAATPDARPSPAATPKAGEAVLATWRMLLDLGRMQDGEPHLARTARNPVARVSAATAAEVGVGDRSLLVVATDRGTVRLPVVITDMPDRVVWLPSKSPGSAVLRDLCAHAGDVVQLSSGGAA
jgi:NADH-quinone oxidoreductase subunit G